MSLKIRNRDYTLIIDRSKSMATPAQPDGQSRWEVMQESILALARKCEEFDPNGITVYLFSDSFQRHDKLVSSQVTQLFENLFESHTPSGGTNLIPVLQHAINDYFERKALGQAMTSGETILVLTDGEPLPSVGLSDVIINTTHRMEHEEELAISFIQAGSDAKATQFFKALDDLLQGIGAKFDICDTVTLEDMEEIPLTEVLLNAIVD